MKKSSRSILYGLHFGIVLVGLCVPLVGRAGLVAAWGNNTYGQTRQPNGLKNVKALAAGWQHNLALKSDGTVIAWGRSDAGQTNIPSGLSGVTAISAGNNWNLALKADGAIVAWGAYGKDFHLAGLSNVTAISAGWYHWLALKADGTLVTWGAGNNSYSPNNVPSGLSNITAIATGSEFSMALKADGTVVAWGWNAYGQTNVSPSLSNVVAIAAGLYHGLALKADGTVVAWGYNVFGQTNVPSGLSDVVAIAGGADHSLALKADGSVVGWGGNSYGQTNVPTSLVNASAIAAGGYHNLALVSDGPIQILQSPQGQQLPYTSNVTFSVTPRGQEPLSYQWFRNGSAVANGGRVSGATSATLTITNLQFADIGTYTVIVSNAFGSVISSGATLTVISPPFITQQPVDRTVRAGSDLTLSAAASGTPPLNYQWSLNGTKLPGQTFTAFSLFNVQPDASGIYSLLVTNVYGSTQSFLSLTVTDSPPYILQQPYSRQPDQSTVTNPVVPIGGSVTLNVGARGSLPLSYQWRFNGADIPSATNATLGLSNLRYDQAGFYTVAVKNAFGEIISAKAFLNVVQVLAWGSAFAGNTNMPAGLTNVIAIAAGGSHITALRTDGTVKTWLANIGYIFDSGPAITNVPASVTNVISIAAGRDHSLALRSNGTVVAWGGNTSGQTNVPTGLSNVVTVAAGWYRSYAVKSDGTVVGWGSQATVPSGLSNVVAIAAGPSHNLALKRDGTVAAWGTPAALTNVPKGLSNVIAVSAGFSQNLALKRDGTVTAWGSGPPFPSNLSNVVAVAAGSFANAALKQDGAVILAGSFGRTPNPVLRNITAIAVGGVQGVFGVALVGNGAPALTLQPNSQIVQKSTTVQLHARAAGVQPVTYQWQVENLNIPGGTNASLIITNVQGKDTGSYRMLASNTLGSAFSTTAQLTIPFSTNLPAALNATNLVWDSFSSTSKTAGVWFAQIRENHDGDTAAQSGAISHNQQSGLSTTVTGPGRLTFWWKVSSEAGYDFLKFSLDNAMIPLASISGEAGWEQKIFSIPSGSHVLRWAYVKDGTVSSGRDAGWVDEVVFTPPPPTILRQPFNQTASMGANVTIPAFAGGPQPLSYQWLKNGTNLPGATAQYLTLNNVTRRDSAIYALRVSNAGGSIMSSNASLKVIVRQRLNPPQRLADGSMLLLSRDANGGALLAEERTAFEVQASTNVKDWVTLPLVPTLTNGTLVLHDTNSSNFPMRFYRIVEH